MQQVKEWLVLDPLDTLFFKGSEPMQAGENHEVRTVFPPMPSTIMGAITTAILRQRHLNPREFTRDGGPSSEISQNYPLLGSPGKPGFAILGPLFRLTNSAGTMDWLLPAPAHWYSELPDSKQEQMQEISLKRADLLSDAAVSLGVCGSVATPVWLRQPAPQGLESLAGCWLNPAALQAMREDQDKVFFFPHLDRPWDEPLRKKIQPHKPTILPSKALSGYESRTGIALTPLARRVRQGHLYAATQVRLHAGVALLVGLSAKLCPDYLNPTGVLQLGGEQRVAGYQVLPASQFQVDPGNSPWIMSLSPLPYNRLRENGWEAHPRASGPLIRLAGWDMQKNFHKAITAYLPAGTVIRTGVDEAAPFGFIRL